MIRESIEGAILVICPDHLRLCLRIAASMLGISERLRTSLLVCRFCHLILKIGAWLVRDVQVFPGFSIQGPCIANVEQGGDGNGDGVQIMSLLREPR